MITKMKTPHCGMSVTETMANITARMNATDPAGGESEFIHELTMIAVRTSLEKVGYKKNKL